MTTLRSDINDGLIFVLFLGLIGLLAYRFRAVVPESQREKGMRLFYHYLFGSIASGWNGAIAAVYGLLGLTAGASFDPVNISPPSLHTVYYIFGVAFGVSSIEFFKKNPIPTDFISPGGSNPPIPLKPQI